MSPFTSPDSSTPAEGASDDISTALWSRIERVTQNDHEKTTLLKELVCRYQYLSEQYQKECEAWKRDKHYYEEHMMTLQLCLERDPFVVVLVDGDRMVFNNELFSAGEEGGRTAAGRLHSDILSHVLHETETIPTDVRVVCRVYANVRNLAEVLVRNGVATDVGVVEQFTRGFTQGKLLFDFVDVGPGNGRAEEKIIESLKLYLSDFHCRQIFLGCTYDNGYALILEDKAADMVALSRITLIEGVPFEKQLLDFPFATKQFPAVFRDTSLLAWSPPYTNGAPKTNGTINGLPLRFPPPLARKNGLLDSPMQTHAVPDLPRSASTSTLSSTEGWKQVSSSNAVPNSWAAKAAAPPPVVTEPPNHKSTRHEEIIPRNRYGQRVDPACRDYDKAEVDRIKKMKMCNVHFLRQECPYGQKCTHVHDYKPTKDELSSLKLVARMAPCINGSICTDTKCIYGHRCPAPKGRNWTKGTTGKSCIFGDQCKFPVELHDLDTTVVKTLVIR